MVNLELGTRLLLLWQFVVDSGESGGVNSDRTGLWLVRLDRNWLKFPGPLLAWWFEFALTILSGAVVGIEMARIKCVYTRESYWQSARNKEMCIRCGFFSVQRRNEPSSRTLWSTTSALDVQVLAAEPRIFCCQAKHDRHQGLVQCCCCCETSVQVQAGALIPVRHLMQ